MGGAAYCHTRIIWSYDNCYVISTFSCYIWKSWHSSLETCFGMTCLILHCIRIALNNLMCYIRQYTNTDVRWNWRLHAKIITTTNDSWNFYQSVMVLKCLNQFSSQNVFLKNTLFRGTALHWSVLLGTFLWNKNHYF